MFSTWIETGRVTTTITSSRCFDAVRGVSSKVSPSHAVYWDPTLQDLRVFVSQPRMVLQVSNTDENIVRVSFPLRIRRLVTNTRSDIDVPPNSKPRK